MKTFITTFLLLFFCIASYSQSGQINPNLKTEQAVFEKALINESQNISPDKPINKIESFPGTKSTSDISVVFIGTSANAYGYGHHGGQRAIINVDNELGIITHHHRMGGSLDPYQFSGDLGIDISYNDGMSWDCMIEIHTANIEIPGIYCNPVDGARYPNHGIFNPPGNTDPNEAYAVYFAPITWCIECSAWGGYIFGATKIGDPSVSSKTMFCSDTALGIHQNVPDGFTLNSNGEFWAIDNNINLVDETWMHALIVNRGSWDEQADEFVLQQELMPCQTLTGDIAPPCNRVEFSPDGQTGYIVVLTDNGEVELSANRSLYPVLYKTEDGGETWGDPVAVAIAGEDGISAVQNFLSDEELEELIFGVPPDRDKIEFTTAYDFDLSVDAFGNPHIAVIVGITGLDPYSIVTDISPSTGKMFTAAFLLSSTNKGEPGSWLAYELGRPVSFRGIFDEDGYFIEDNRIQIARDHSATKMFVSWLDTDLEVSDENDNPNIWARGVDIVNHKLTVDELGEALPNNVTQNSMAQDSARFFAMGNEVLDNNGIYTLPYTYEVWYAEDPSYPVQYKYIRDFQYSDADFQIVGLGDEEALPSDLFSVSTFVPNPAKITSQIQITLGKPALVKTHICDIMGKMIGQVIQHKLQSGINKVLLDVSALTPGIYFYTLEMDSQRITRKICVK